MRRYLHRATRTTEDATLKREADGDVSINGEAQYQQLIEILRHDVENVDQLAGDRVMVDLNRPQEFQCVDRVHNEENETIDRQCGDINGRRASHSFLEPDLGRQSVSGQTNDQPQYEQDATEPQGFRNEACVHCDICWVSLVNRWETCSVKFDRRVALRRRDEKPVFINHLLFR